MPQFFLVAAVDQATRLGNDGVLQHQALVQG